MNKVNIKIAMKVDFIRKQKHDLFLKKKCVSKLILESEKYTKALKVCTIPLEIISSRKEVRFELIT